MRLTRVVSGGQTGADRAALDAARALGLPHGGWCPRGGLAEDHAEPPGLLTAYPSLRETPDVDPGLYDAARRTLGAVLRALVSDSGPAATGPRAAT